MCKYMQIHSDLALDLYLKTDLKINLGWQPDLSLLGTLKLIEIIYVYIFIYVYIHEIIVTVHAN